MWLLMAGVVVVLVAVVVVVSIMWILTYRVRRLHVEVDMKFPQLTVTARTPGVVQAGDTFTFADRDVTIQIHKVHSHNSKTRTQLFATPLKAEYLGEYVVVGTAPVGNASGSGAGASELFVNGIVRIVDTSPAAAAYQGHMFHLVGVATRVMETNSSNVVTKNTLVSTNICVSGGTGIFAGASGTWTALQKTESSGPGVADVVALADIRVHHA